MGNEKKWADHAEFLKEMAYHIGGVLLCTGGEQAEALAIYTGWLAENCFNHAEKHMRDADKINPSEQNEGVVEREEVNAGLRMYEEHVVGSRPTWDEAKRGPVSTQEEIGERWKEAEKDG